MSRNTFSEYGTIQYCIGQAELLSKSRECNKLKRITITPLETGMARITWTWQAQAGLTKPERSKRE